MKFRLPIVGEVKINEAPEIKEVIKAANKDIFGSFLDFPSSSTTSVSSKLLQANRGWVYRNNDVIAKEVATIEFELYTTRIVGEEIQYKQITSHALLDALDRFNDFTDASTGFYTTQSHKKLTGNAYWYIDGSGTNVQAIYILMPDKVTIKLGKTAGSQVEIDSYEYNDNIEGKKVAEVYSPDEVIHFKAPNPENYLRGLGAVEAAAADIDLDVLATKANMAMFKRGLIANFILATDNSLNPDQLKQLRAEFKSAYSGIDNAYKVPILSGGLKPESIQVTNKDMEFMALQTWTRDKIMSIFGNTPAALGIIDDVNRANSESTLDHWRKTTVRAEMKQITDTLNEFLVPRFGKNLILGFKELVQDDKLTDIKTMIDENVITPNEAREILGYDPIEGGDTLREGLKVPIVPEIPKALRYVDRQKMLRKAGAYKEVDKYKAARRITDKLARKILTKKSQVDPKISQVYYSKQIKLVEAAEHIFQQKVEKFINRLIEKAISNVPHVAEAMQNKSLFNDDDEVNQAVVDFMPILLELSAAAGTEALHLIHSDRPYITKLRSLIEQRVKLFATSMVQTDKEKLIDIIAEGITEGQSIPQIRNNIVDKFETYSKSQAERITRTEVLRVSNQSAIDAWTQSGEVEGKQWLTAPGADEECAVYEGQIVWDLAGSFYSSESEFEDGDPPLHPNCRCVILPVTSNDKSLTPQSRKELNYNKRIKELESQIDKRKKAFKKLKAEKLDDEAYIKRMEDYLEA